VYQKKSSKLGCSSVDKLTPVSSGAGVLLLSVVVDGVSSSGDGVVSGAPSTGSGVMDAVSFVPGAGGFFPAAACKLGGMVRMPITSISRLDAISTAIKPFFI
jgi:hypothetical protein